ncbi:uncharacterized protein DS421_5g142350 [Arachis hypogaea]|nr:uncharacterized protein DS421_5g142350 [Arachis hypogaea]
MARAPYELESDNRWLGGWAPETLLGGLEAARSDVSRSWVGSRNANGWTAGGEVGRGEVGGGSRNAAGVLGGLEAARSQVAWSEVAPETLFGGGLEAGSCTGGGGSPLFGGGIWRGKLSACRSVTHVGKEKGTGEVGVWPSLSHSHLTRHKSRMGGWGIGVRSGSVLNTPIREPYSISICLSEIPTNESA